MGMNTDEIWISGRLSLTFNYWSPQIKASYRPMRRLAALPCNRTTAPNHHHHVDEIVSETRKPRYDREGVLLGALYLVADLRIVMERSEDKRDIYDMRGRSVKCDTPRSPRSRSASCSSRRALSARRRLHSATASSLSSLSVCMYIILRLLEISAVRLFFSRRAHLLSSSDIPGVGLRPRFFGVLGNCWAVAVAVAVAIASLAILSSSRPGAWGSEHCCDLYCPSCILNSNSLCIGAHYNHSHFR